MRAIALVVVVMGGCTAVPSERAVPVTPSAPAPHATIVLTQRHIERRELAAPSRSGCKTHRRWTNVLRFDGVRTPVPLARSAECTHEPPAPADRFGLDRKSVRVRWLDPGRIVSVSWHTVFAGSGGFVHDGRAVLAVDGSELVELFRTHYWASVRMGWGFQQSTDLDIRFDATTSELTLVEKDDYMEASMPGDGSDVSAAPFAVRSGHGHVVHVVTEKQWTYAVAGTRLAYRGGRVRTRLGAPGSAPAKIAAHYKVDVARVVALNPDRDPAGRWTGVVLVRDDLPPYLPDADDGLCGDGPCGDDPCEANL